MPLTIIGGIFGVGGVGAGTFSPLEPVAKLDVPEFEIDCSILSVAGGGCDVYEFNELRSSDFAFVLRFLRRLVFATNGGGE